jgi:acyl phosphate:glycerol-3-phosphate acyltransferase
MPENIILLTCFLTAYILGSVPTAVWVGRIVYGCDVRNFGSGNAGATNTFRVLGRGAGLVVLLIDVVKGLFAAGLANLLVDRGIINPDQQTLYQIFLGVTAIIGHIFPLFAQFRGGKGVATMVGMILTIQLEVALICIGIFALVLISSRYVSLGSIVASFAFPILLATTYFEQFVDTRTTVIAFSLFAIVIVTHQKNIQRLLNGSESKSVIRLRKKRVG